MTQRNKDARARQAPPRTRKTSRAHAWGVCTTCKEKKRLTEFHKNGSGQKYEANDRRRYRSSCAECTRVRSALSADPKFTPDTNRRRKRPETRATAIHAGNAEAKRRLRRRTRISCLKYLAKHGCKICGERDPRVLEFDHLEPLDKEYTISGLISGGYSWASEILRREVCKCRILCANCHRKHTIEQQAYYSHADVRAALAVIFRDYDIAE